MVKKIIYPDSSSLLKLMSDNNLSLFDMHHIAKFSGDPTTLQPVKELALRGDYVVTPKPQQGENLEDIISRVNDFVPGLIVPNSQAYSGIEGVGSLPFGRGNLIYIFSRLFLRNVNKENVIIATSPGIQGVKEVPLFVLPWEQTMEKFNKYFKVVSSQEFQEGIKQARTIVMRGYPTTLLGHEQEGQA